MSDTSPATGPDYDVAVVFVHGVGNQKQGSGTRSLAHAIFRWAERETNKPQNTLLAGTKVVAVRTQLAGPGATSSVLEVSTGEGKERWLVTEAWWAESYEPPTAWATLHWLAVYAPLAVVTRCLEAVLSAWHSSWRRPLQWWRIFTACALVLLAPPVSAVVLMVSFVATFLRALIPINWVRSLLDALVRILTRVLGDAFMFTIDPVVRNAMETVVADRLAELRAVAGRVVVVAHSQGAAIVASIAQSQFADTEPDPATGEGGSADPWAPRAPMRLVTLGAGIVQLEWLHRVRRNGHLLSGTIAYYLSVLGFVLLVFVISSTTLGINNELVVLFGMAAGWWLLPLGIYKLIVDCYGSGFAVVTPKNVRLAVPGFSSWVNLAATADPVSGTYDLGQMFKGVESRQVRNHNSLLRDHTAYLANSAECASTIVEAALGPASSTAQESSGVRASRSSTRHRAGQLLVWSRLLIATGTVLALVGLRDEVRGYGDEGLEHVPGWLLPMVESYSLPVVGKTDLAPAYGVAAVLVAAGAVYLVAVLMVRITERGDLGARAVLAVSGLVIYWSLGALVSGLVAITDRRVVTLTEVGGALGLVLVSLGATSLGSLLVSKNAVVKTWPTFRYGAGLFAVALSAVYSISLVLTGGGSDSIGYPLLFAIVGSSIVLAALTSTLPRSAPPGPRVGTYVKDQFINRTWPPPVERDEKIVPHVLTVLGFLGCGVQYWILQSASAEFRTWQLGFSVLISYAYSVSLFEYSNKLRAVLGAVLWVFSVLVLREFSIS